MSAQPHYSGRTAPEPRFIHRWPLTTAVLLVTFFAAFWALLVMTTATAVAVLAVGLLLMLLVLRFVDWWARVPLIWESAAIDAGLQKVSSGVPRLRGFAPNLFDRSLALRIEKRKNSLEEVKKSAASLANSLSFGSCEVEVGKRTYRLLFRPELDQDSQGPEWAE